MMATRVVKRMATRVAKRMAIRVAGRMAIRPVDDGYQTGKGDGRTEMLRQVIRTMLTNGKTVSQIAVDLGMDEKSVSDLGGRS